VGVGRRRLGLPGFFVSGGLQFEVGYWGLWRTRTYIFAMLCYFFVLGRGVDLVRANARVKISEAA
jgi:hypothetical protein